MDTAVIPPFVAPDALTGQAPIVVLAPHPYDEILGCGCLLAYAFAHDGAQFICMTDGGASHPGSKDWPPARLSAARRSELCNAVTCLGGTPADVTWLDHPDGWLGAQNQGAIAARISAICRDLGARHLFASAKQDHHEDHKSTARIAGLVAAAVPGLTHFAYPVWSRHDDPNLLTHIAHHRPQAIDPAPASARKRAAISANATQLGGVITDDPAGFSLRPGLIEMFIQTPEIYWKVTA